MRAQIGGEGVRGREMRRERTRVKGWMEVREGERCTGRKTANHDDSLRLSVRVKEARETGRGWE